MMFEVINQTPFLDALIPGLDRDDVAHLTVLLKGTFQIGAAGGPVTWAEQQVPIQHGDQPNGPDPATSSVRYESDLCPLKRGTDVVLLGHAHAGTRRRQTVDVALEVGPLRKLIRVSGDRVWTRSAAAWIISRPVAFDRLPLCYERAFGGVDLTDPDPARHAADPRNPAGTGFAVSARRDRLEGLRLPNLEDPGAPVTDWDSRPPVAGFGFVSRAWLPRRPLAGTFDATWTRERAPLLPADFDPRFFNGAPVDQVITPHLGAGAAVRIAGATPDGLLSFQLPRDVPSVQVQIGTTWQALAPRLDTVIIEPDRQRVVICWRDTFRCGRRLRQVRRVMVKPA